MTYEEWEAEQIALGAFDDEEESPTIENEESQDSLSQDKELAPEDNISFEEWEKQQEALGAFDDEKTPEQLKSEELRARDDNIVQDTAQEVVAIGEMVAQAPAGIIKVLGVGYLAPVLAANGSQNPLSEARQILEEGMEGNEFLSAINNPVKKLAEVFNREDAVSELKDTSNFGNFMGYLGEKVVEASSNASGADAEGEGGNENIAAGIRETFEAGLTLFGVKVAKPKPKVEMTRLEREAGPASQRILLAFKETKKDLAKHADDSVDNLEGIPDAPMADRFKTFDDLVEEGLPEDIFVKEFTQRAKKNDSVTISEAEHLYRTLKKETLEFENIIEEGVPNPYSKGYSTYFAETQKYLGDKTLKKAETMEREIITGPVEAIKAVEEMVETFTPEEFSVLQDLSYLDNRSFKNRTIIKETIGNMSKEAQESFAKYKKATDTFAEKAVEVGIFKKSDIMEKGGGIRIHLPRIVADYEGLTKELGHPKSLSDSIKVMEEKLGNRELTEVERSMLVDNWMRRNLTQDRIRELASAPRASSVNARKINGVEENLQGFYHPLKDSMRLHAEAMSEEIATSKFLGAPVRGDKGSTVTDGLNKILKEYENGDYASMKNRGKVEELLKARFVTGRTPTSKMNQQLRDATMAVLLNSGGSVAMQFSDLMNVVSVSGPTLKSSVLGTVESVVKGAVGKNIRGVNAKDFGLTDSYRHLDTQNPSKISRWLNAELGFTGFRKIDNGMKTVALNASINSARRAIKADAKAIFKSPDARKTFDMEWGPRYEPKEFAQLKRDLAQGAPTDLVLNYAFSNIARTQAVSKGNKAVQALLSQDTTFGTMFYSLKTYAFNMLSNYQTMAMRKIKRGDIKGGAADMAKLTSAIYLSGNAGKGAYNFLVGKDNKEFEASDVPLAVLQLAGISRRTGDAFASGDFLDIVGGQFAPIGAGNKIFKGGQDIYKDTLGDGDSRKRYLDWLPLGHDTRDVFFEGSEHYNDMMERYED